MEDNNSLKKIGKKKEFRALFLVLSNPFWAKTLFMWASKSKLCFSYWALEEPIPVWCQKGISLLTWKKEN